ncbi:MAG TPA: hypothetical protein VEK08_22340 [Planctomycetota bacterium]|nr:hypothetical protein [Planctomycetota bacterium]
MQRRWLQLHLSTCLVLMFLAGGIVYSNTRLHFVKAEPAIQSQYVGS